MTHIEMTGSKMWDFFLETEIGSIDDVALFLKVSPRTLYMWRDHGKIPHRHHKKLQDHIDERKSLKIKQTLDRVEIGQLIRAIEKRGYNVTLESK